MKNLAHILLFICVWIGCYFLWTFHTFSGPGENVMADLWWGTTNFLGGIAAFSIAMNIFIRNVIAP